MAGGKLSLILMNLKLGFDACLEVIAISMASWDERSTVWAFGNAS